MMTLVGFLSARLDEDEAAARAATSGPWRYDPGKVNAVDRGEAVFAGERGAGAITVASTGPANDAPSMFDAAHVARHDPARVLREVEAKRAIVEDYQILHRDYRETHDPTTEARRLQALIEVARLAAVYADHPDYDEGWRP